MATKSYWFSGHLVVPSTIKQSITSDHLALKVVNFGNVPLWRELITLWQVWTETMGTKHSPDWQRSVASDWIAIELHWCAAGLTLHKFWCQYFSPRCYKLSISVNNFLVLVNFRTVTKIEQTLTLAPIFKSTLQVLE